ncbi:hypothetical protein ACP70R_003233 [Stipagrostis hirtigluma subsp. patula]
MFPAILLLLLLYALQPMTSSFAQASAQPFINEPVSDRDTLLQFKARLSPSLPHFCRGTLVISVTGLVLPAALSTTAG